MAKHTPGPWYIVHEFNVYGPNNRLTANCGGKSSNVDSEKVYFENNANARLTASAPDLLEALKEAREGLLYLVAFIKDNEIKGCYEEFTERWVQAEISAEAAIAKAEGNEDA